MSWTIGVDVGGTFTDFYAVDTATGETRLAKRPSTPDDPGRAILEGLAALAADGIPLDGLRRLAHGTTVATNALIQRRGGRVALVTTRGFGDLLEIGRQVRPHMYDLWRDQPPPLVPPERRFEIGERVTADGAVLRAIDPDELAAVVERVKASGAEACAVCFLFAFLRPDHERQVAEALGAAMPGLHLSLSSEVQPEFREYERFATTAINAYLQPVMDRYVGGLAAGLAELAQTAALGINQSSGGLMSAEQARRFPVRTALSGPAAGAVGAIRAARRGGRADVVTLDMGGTSADVALIRGLRADLSFQREVADFPIRLPMLDIATVGAGGGSIAWFDRDGLLKVGPASAGAVPGPACYGRGGTEPTVSDANLVLGRLSPRGLLGGGMALDPDRARAAFAPVAERLGMSVERAAHGALAIVVATMIRAIRTVSVERGHDPRGFALMPFGGAGPLHAREVAAGLGMREIVVPPAPGIVCAEGLIVADLEENVVAAHRAPVDEAAHAALLAAAAGLIATADRWFAAEAVPEAGRGVSLALDMRYVGQNFELIVPVASGAVLDAAVLPDAAALRALFFAAHDRAYGYYDPEAPVETVALRLTASGRLWREPPEAPPEADPPPPVPFARRPVWFAADAPADTAVYDRSSLRPGQAIEGPAVIEQLDATTLVHPGDVARVDAAGNILIGVGA